jgi:hypothetical protein
MAKRNQTVRFAFGTHDTPASAVWRATSNGKAGDIYLQNAPQHANTVHVALHASGKFSFKIGEVRHHMEPPFEYQDGCFYGPLIFFKSFNRQAPPTQATGSVSLINWLGFPAPDCIFMLKLIYTPPSTRMVVNSDETLIGQIATCKLFHKPMMLHFVLQHRALIESERSAKWHMEELDFGGNNPERAEMIRVSKTDLGPSAIIHQQFNFSPGPSEI